MGTINNREEELIVTADVAWLTVIANIKTVLVVVVLDATTLTIAITLILAIGITEEIDFTRTAKATVLKTIVKQIIVLKYPEVKCYLKWEEL